MDRYQLYYSEVHLPLANGETIALSLTAHSGRIVYRDKIDTIIGIKHPGIEIAVDQYGYRWIAHHHYENGTATIDREDVFSKGQPIFYDDREVFYDQATIVQRALDSWQAGKEYHWLRQNCQHYVNEVTRGRHQSEAVEKVSDGALVGGAILAIVGLLTRNKGLMQAGLAIGTAGGAAKLINKL